MTLNDIIYTPVQTPVLGNSDLSTLKNTINTLNQFDFNRMEQRNEIAKSINEYRNILVDDKDGTNYQFLYNLQNQIEQSINSPIERGDYRTGMMNAFKEAGNLFLNPELSARVKSSAEYRTWKENLMNRNDIDDDTKQWALNLNSYKHENIYDNNGSVIGGKTWMPNYNPVSDVDFTEIYAKAAKLMSTEVGGGSTIYYRGEDENGNSFYTTDISQSVDNLPYYEKDNGYYNYNRKDFENAVKTVLHSDRAYLAGMQQKYNKYKDQIKTDEEGNIIPNQVTDANGGLLSFDEYINSLINPMLNASIVYVPSSGITELSAQRNYADMINSIAKGGSRSSKAASNGIDDGSLSGSYLELLRGGETTQAVITYASNVSALKSTMDSDEIYLREFARDFGINTLYEDKTNRSINDIYSELVKAIQTDTMVSEGDKVGILFDLQKRYNDYLEKESAFNNAIDADSRDSFNFVSAVESNDDLRTLKKNSYNKKLIKDINELFSIKRVSSTLNSTIPLDSIEFDLSTNENKTKIKNIYRNVFGDNISGNTFSLDKTTNQTDLVQFALELRRNNIEINDINDKPFTKYILNQYDKATRDNIKYSNKHLNDKLAYNNVNLNIFGTQSYAEDIFKSYIPNTTEYDRIMKIAEKDVIDQLTQVNFLGNKDLFISNYEKDNNLYNPLLGDVKTKTIETVTALLKSNSPAVNINFSIAEGNVGTVIQVNPKALTENQKEQFGTGNINDNKTFNIYFDYIPNSLAKELQNSSSYTAARAINDKLLLGIDNFKIGDDNIYYNRDPNVPENQRFIVNGERYATKEEIISLKQRDVEKEAIINELGYYDAYNITRPNNINAFNELIIKFANAFGVIDDIDSVKRTVIQLMRNGDKYLSENNND